MVQLKLGLTSLTDSSLATKVEQLRAFAQDHNTINIAAKGTEPENPGVTFVTFEFDVAGDEVYQELGRLCVRWLDEREESGVMGYGLNRYC